jgi:hypothetical protein
MAGAGKLGDACDFDGRSAGAMDARAHLGEAIGEVLDLGLAGCIANKRRAMGGGRCHHRGMGASDRHLREGDFAADEAVRRLGDDIAGVNLDFRSQLLQRHQQKVDRSRADRAAAGQRDTGFSGARQERRDDPEACAHFRDKVIGRGRIDDLAGGQMRRLAGIDALPGPLAVQRIIDAVIAEDAHE